MSLLRRFTEDQWTVVLAMVFFILGTGLILISGSWTVAALIWGGIFIWTGLYLIGELRD